MAGLFLQLLPRYRRVLGFGDVLDESMFLFRQHWVSYALVSAIALIPPGLVVVWVSASGLISGAFDLTDLREGGLASGAGLTGRDLLPVLATGVVSAVFEFFWIAAIISTTAAYLRGEPPDVVGIYVQALRRFFVLLLATVLFSIGLLVVGALGSVLFVVTLFGTLGSVVAVIALLFWWLKAGARRPWLKWLIILVAPFGLPVYFSTRWSMFVAAAVLEGHGPLGSLRRSSALVDRQGFRVLSILTVSSVIVGVMVYAPAALIEIPLAISAATRGEIGFGPTEATISNAASIVLRILFASVGGIIYTLLFFDLRNRREGSDLVERLTLLEASR